MPSAWIPFGVFTAFWAIVGIIVPIFIPKGPNRGIIQTMIIMTAICCYLFWLCTFLMQLNPLIGPQLLNSTVWMIKQQW